MSNYALRIPDSLFAYAKKVAEEENVSMNQFFVMAIAEKVSALKTVEFFSERRRRAKLHRFEEIMAKIPDNAPQPGDELRKQSPAAHEPRAAYAVTKARKPKGTTKKPVARKSIKRT